MAADPGKGVRACRRKKMLRLLRWSDDSRVQELRAAAGQRWAVYGGGGGKGCGGGGVGRGGGGGGGGGREEVVGRGGQKV
jgi:hypothetical protein